MKFLRFFFVFAVMVLGLSSINVQAQDGMRGGAAKQGIERKVYKEIATLPYYGLFDNIGYSISGGTVTLYGKVVQPTTKSSAANVVKHVDGVSQVVNKIEVLPLSPFDDQLRLQVANTLASRGGALYRYLQGANPSMRIIVNRGNVSLEGYVANKSDSTLATILTKSISNVFNVENNLIVTNSRG